MFFPLPSDLYAELLSDQRNKALARLQADREALRSLGWSDEELARYQARVSGIHRRFDAVTGRHSAHPPHNNTPAHPASGNNTPANPDQDGHVLRGGSH